MKVNVLLFGQLTEITGIATLSFNDIHDTEELMNHLYDLYPALRNKSYACAVDMKIISGKTTLLNNSTVALLPPFSGG